MLKQRRRLPVADYLTVTQAARLVGVTAATLRNWDRTDKLNPHRHPLNGYRLYRREDLLSFLERIVASAGDSRDVKGA
jgi:DNA-binding transcriptional MerR regulator